MTSSLRPSRAFALSLAAAAAVVACKSEAPAPAASAAPSAQAAATPPAAPSPTPAPPTKQDQSMANNGIPQGSGDLYALFKTTRGTITVQLFEKDAPKTVANFVGLATGAKEWTDPRTGAKSHGKLYDGTQFHRVIPQFMIQGGDPLGQGVGGPGYKFEDEFGSGKKFDKPGLLAMANAGPNTNGSQFFITEVPTPHLNNKHTIFGEVVKGFELVPQIARAGNAQTQLSHVEIVRSASVPQ
ncbi:MAG TPA: peptidylprolyl isomerase [Myxococcales bacterium]|jgi:peptidyl-prolyl cis-trans isomerase A (cyclophilin A)|nr:peptidylprolyl isomerase [Myxococcales bacterium]